MTKWTDQSALDAAINRRRYFLLFRHFTSRCDPMQAVFARALAFHIFINCHYSASALQRLPRARRFPARKAEADDAHRAHGSLQRRIKLQLAWRRD